MTSTVTRLAFYLNVALDWERLGPIWAAAQKRRDLDVRLVASRKFLRWSSPSVLKHCGDTISQRQLYAGLFWSWHPRALLTATESSAFPHRRSYLLTRICNLLDITTITLQHGFECVGISYIDKKYGAETRIASRHILTWCPTDLLPGVFQKTIGDRASALGFVAAPPDSEGVRKLREYLQEMNGISPERKHLLVTENLHWHRYNQDYRDAFVRGVIQVAVAHPEVKFFVRPHPARNYFGRDAGLELPENLVLTTSLPEAIASINITSWVTCCDGLITTPSTTAVDAAVAGKPVLLVKDSDPQNWSYDPLLTIDDESGWLSSVSLMLENTGLLQEKSGQFVSRQLAGITDPDTVLDHIVALSRG